MRTKAPFCSLLLQNPRDARSRPLSSVISPLFAQGTNSANVDQPTLSGELELETEKIRDAAHCMKEVRRKEIRKDGRWLLNLDIISVSEFLLNG